MLFPLTCPVCGAVGAAPCATCVASLRSATPGPLPAGTSSCRALLDYSGAGRELVARLKYRNARSSLRWLAAAMAMLVDPAAVDVVTWAPTTSARRRARGFDQAQLLARAVARNLNRPCRRLLTRRNGPAQTGRDQDGRRAGPSFGAKRRAPARVLLIDDIVTTGATVGAAARALRESGATEVQVLAAAHTSRRAYNPNRDGSHDSMPACRPT
ncbi:MAG TPA: phosphoribosyltransferase family protein [Acidimicrobiales bacterium]|nr:phosphoribosyltransferase family protein [Acidimicrobiales bacterium]